MCSGVSIEQARGFRLKTQWLYIGYIASSIGVFGPLSGVIQIERLHRPHLVEIERGEAVALRGAQIAARTLDPQHLDLSPVSGSFSSSFDEVLPPPVLVSVRSSPSLFER